MNTHHPECDYDPYANRFQCNCEFLSKRDKDRARRPYTYREVLLCELATNPDINSNKEHLYIQVGRILDYLRNSVAPDIREKFHFEIRLKKLEIGSDY